jgi:peroxidase
MAAAAVRSLLVVAVVLAPLLAGAGGLLSTSFYSKKCPNVQGIVRAGMASAMAAESAWARPSSACSSTTASSM